jgi:DDE superfamily endonuclease/Helix-turn-helix of DDE superfamily endonuclease
MLTYEELKKNPRKFVSLTSLTPEEFDYLRPAFERAYLNAYPVSKTMTGEKRKRKAGGGRKGALASIEQKLLFGLVYQKSYPVQSIMGEVFGMGPTQANEWIHSLLPILKRALNDLGYEPERDPKKFKETEQDRKDSATSIMDGTERRRQRPQDAKKQALHYSGKKKIHSDKNLIIATAKKKRVSFLSQTDPGKTHDKKVADTEKISSPKQMTLYQDTGFQGYEPQVRKSVQPKKSLTRKN